MKGRTKITENTWRAVRQMLKRGLKPIDIEKKLNGSVTRGQIYRKKQVWDRQDYRTKAKYAKYRTPEYKAWREAVLERDGHKCIICKRGRSQVKVLQVDHIKSWSKYPDLRYDVNNGRTLCVYHHRRTLNYGFKALNCDDELNGRAWVIKERNLWKQKQWKKLKPIKKNKTKKSLKDSV